MHLGVSLPTFASAPDAAIPALPPLAVLAEQTGLDAVWAADHLTAGVPLIESTVALSAAAAVTERIQLGYAVLLLALRQQAWAARQLASLHYISGHRLILGVGTGGEIAQEWPIAGVSARGRGARTDLMLDDLPGLLAGQPTRLSTEPDAPPVTLGPAVPMPPLWIGGMSARAHRRVVTYGAGWLASMLSPAQLADAVTTLSEYAAEQGRPAPEVGTTVFAAPSTDRGHQGRALHMTRLAPLAKKFGLSEEQADQLVVDGPPEALAERLHQLLDAGANTFVVHLSGPDLPRQIELLGTARELVAGA